MRSFVRIKIDHSVLPFEGIVQTVKRKALPRNSYDTFIPRKSTDAGICDRAPDTLIGPYRTSTISYLKLMSKLKLFFQNLTYLFHMCSFFRVRIIAHL